MTKIHLRVAVSLVLASALGAHAAVSAPARGAAQVPEAMVAPVAVKHTRRTVTHKTVTHRTTTRRTVRHHTSTAHAQATQGAHTTK